MNSGEGVARGGEGVARVVYFLSRGGGYKFLSSLEINRCSCVTGFYVIMLRWRD